MKHLTAKNIQRAFTGFVLLVLLVSAVVFGINFSLLQRPLNRVIAQDARNQGIRVSVYYESYLDPDIVVFDVRAADPPAGHAGLLRVFFQFAREMQGRNIETVILGYRGNQKLKIDGDDFLELGASFGTVTLKQLIWQLARDMRLLNGKLVMTSIPGDYAALLQKNLGEMSEEGQAASALFSTFTQ